MKTLNLDVELNKTSTVNYRGIVTVRVAQKDKIVATRVYKNSGLTPLFDVISKALAGKAQQADLPGCLRIYTMTRDNAALTSPEQIITTGWTDSLTESVLGGTAENLSNNQVLVPISKNIFMAETPVINANNTASGTAEISFQFKIPSDVINALDFEKQIYAMALMPSRSTASGHDALAYYLFSNGNSWDPINFTNASKDFSLYVEWTMSFSNK